MNIKSPSVDNTDPLTAVIHCSNNYDQAIIMDFFISLTSCLCNSDFSLREVVHDDNVQPKMQCLMMDTSFSMVTMQGEDSGIAWETTPSRCSTPWASEAGYSTMDGTSSAMQPAPVPAGKIIFVMDDELISRRKKSKERVSAQKRAQEERDDSSENVTGRPELVGISEPNVRSKDKKLADPFIDKEQLFSVVSEGSEILNIVVPPKLATVDEEESRVMADNLSYLEESPVPKASEETNDNELLFLNTPPGLAAPIPIKVEVSQPIGIHAMDPPGAPVPRVAVGGPSGNMDYFEAFTLIDAPAPGSPAVVTVRQVEEEADNAALSKTSEKSGQSTNTRFTIAVDNDKLDTVSLQEISSELLDEVFYGSTDDNLMKSLDREVKGVDTKGTPFRVPSKESGSALFGRDEDVLTPIFLPEGPPKIIDPILLEEPKAMAFLYTDLYEEALGSRQKEEDTESMTSEKSFHSRHSDREARGYLEKYALIDETLAVEVETTDKEKGPKEGPRVLTQDVYNFGLLSKPEKSQVPNSEEEITDFFRSSANSSPCDTEPFTRTFDEDDTEVKVKATKNKSVSIKDDKVTVIPIDPLSTSNLPLDELDWGSTEDYPETLDNENFSSHSDQERWKHDSEMEKPVAPPRKKATPKACLDLTPLTPVDIITQENGGAGEPEQSERGKETAEETVEDGEESETMYSSDEVMPFEYPLAADGTEAQQNESDEGDEIIVRKTTPPAAVDSCEPGIQETGPEDVHIESTEPAGTLSEKPGGEPQALPSASVKNKGQCVIL